MFRFRNKRLFYCLSATAHCTIFTNFHRCLVWIFSHPGKKANGIVVLAHPKYGKSQFELDEMIELDFRTFSDNFTASIYFDNEPIHNLLKDWTALKALENSDSKKRVIEAWKNAMLEKMAERKDEYDFKTKSEAQIDLIETLVKEYRERSSYMGGLLEWDIQLTEKELDLLEDALSFLRLNSYERDVIERILEWNCRPLLPF